MPEMLKRGSKTREVRPDVLVHITSAHNRISWLAFMLGAILMNVHLQA